MSAPRDRDAASGAGDIPAIQGFGERDIVQLGEHVQIDAQQLAALLARRQRRMQPQSTCSFVVGAC
ncbi:hypothetical protein [Cognatilysobacter terrigena]|uniref:hypothetical protein n=1 Tax=Cognatilysobacter terrigena TaxID=2488749 RepID=UPI001060CEE4|nr:hypothetical protein [Lysobacter terrigena]